MSGVWARRAASVALLAVAAAACTVNPVTGRNELDLMGEAQELELGRRLFPRYTQASLGEVPDPKLQRYLAGVGLKVAEVSHRPGLPYAFNAVGEPEVNAYALPGGKISITRGLLARLHDEDELAAVLGHEVGHVAARHAARQYTRALLFQTVLLGSAVYMEARGVQHREAYLLGGLVGAQLVLARYSRDQERQADELGFRYAAEAGYSPEGMVGVMEVLVSVRERRPNLVERMFASHPMSEERLATARKRVASTPPELRARPLHERPFLERTRRVREQREAYDRLAEARRLLAEDKGSAALPLLRRSADEWPDDGVLRAFLAAAEADTGRQSAALEDAARAARSAPEVFYPQLIAGAVFLDAKRYDESLEFLDRAAVLLPDEAQVELMRGKALEGVGKPAAAAETYRRVKRLAPGTKIAAEADRRLRRLGGGR